MSGLRLLGPWGCPNPGVGVPGAGGQGREKHPNPGVSWLPPAAREVPGGDPAGLGLVLAPSWPRGISCAGFCGMCRGRAEGPHSHAGFGARGRHIPGAGQHRRVPRRRLPGGGCRAGAGGPGGERAGVGSASALTSAAPGGRRAGSGGGWRCSGASSAAQAGPAPPGMLPCARLCRGAPPVGSGDVPPARVCSHRQRHGLWCGASRSPQRGVTGRAPLSGLARGLKINACECPVEAEAACTIGGNASACKHCFAADTCFLRPAVGTLILQTQRGSGAAPQPPREPGRALASPQPNQGHRQRAVALGRLGDTRHRWLSPGPLPASVATHRAASLPQPRGSRGSPHGAAELGWGLRAARQHQQPRGCPLLSLPSPSPALMLPLSQERL